MPGSDVLRSPNVRAVYALAGECRDLGDDPVVWRQHSFRGLARLVNADSVIGGELADSAAGRPRPLGLIEVGCADGFDRVGWLRILDPLVTGPTPRRCQLTARGTTAGAAVPQRANRHAVYCFRTVPGAGDEVSGAILTRAAGEPDFTAREVAIVQEAFAVLGPLVGGPLARFSEPSPSALPLRCRQVLKCLLDGDGDKQIAARLGLSPYTVNEYTKRVYRHFGVEGRAELLARWVRRGWGLKGGWADPRPEGR
ncbi:MAG: helix-turn-helix transcriptional regulator [Gemmataceae bacterium]|nr:helix-turn-helix transcriptional regulator [Gemmataceae bacterium]